MSAPFFTETPSEAIPASRREVVIVDGHSFHVDVPVDSDKLLDHPAILAAHAADEYMPYWADIWPASRMLAKAVLREAWPWPGVNDRGDGSTKIGETCEKPIALELGCGLGVAGLAALSRGFRVIFSDYDHTALRFAANNARLNGFRDFSVLPLDWRHPPRELRVPLLLGADLLYEVRNIDPILEMIKKVLLPEGTCLLTDPDRTPAPRFRERLKESGLVFDTAFIRAGEPDGRRVKGTLYRIRMA